MGRPSRGRSAQPAAWRSAPHIAISPPRAFLHRGGGRGMRRGPEDPFRRWRRVRSDLYEEVTFLGVRRRVAAFNTRSTTLVVFSGNPREILAHEIPPLPRRATWGRGSRAASALLRACIFCTE